MTPKFLAMSYTRRLRASVREVTSASPPPKADYLHYTVRFPRDLYRRVHQLARKWDCSNVKAMLRAIEDVCTREGV